MSSPTNKFESLILKLSSTEIAKRILKIDLREQFRPGETDETSIGRNLNAAFLIAISGKENPQYDEALSYINDNKSHTMWGGGAEFYLNGLSFIPTELEQAASDDASFGKTLEVISPDMLDTSEMVAIERLREIFFPEGHGVCDMWDSKVTELRDRRMVTITKLNPEPIQEPAKELLFTSNILITTPLEPENIDAIDLPSSLRESLKEAVSEDQSFWYDHPIPVGISPESNEALYGLRGLDDAVGFEKERGNIGRDERLACVLSVSVTHEKLQDIAREYLKEELMKGPALKHLDVHVFTEADTSRLIDQILLPATKKYGIKADAGEVREIVGVDGEYGRHYTFLKAVSAFWHVLVEPRVKGTFKIDLDQIFPQEVLVSQSGASALEHLKSPLWGAEGTDSRGVNVELGMIAGSLVNEKDISKSLFYPDVCKPTHEIRADLSVFISGLPQALSTEAEMMTRYGGEIDGKNECIQRVHVTGGTNGILVDSLRRHRPFTPVFIGRAEDQAYLMSVMFAKPEGNLRYVHKDGLIMRHDKEAFAGEAMRAASLGKLIGDYTRVLWFSYYARALPWPVADTKALLDPFTGCFISHIPFTVVFLRMALKAASFFAAGSDEKTEEGVKFLRMGARRLGRVISYLNADTNPLVEEYEKERRVWNAYYDTLDRLEEGLKNAEPFAISIREKARALAADCSVSLS